MKGKTKEQSSNPSEKHLSFPDVVPIDHTKTCPRYTSILNRQDGHGVGIEEMDSLQMEIESLLVSAMQRNRLLKIESAILDNEKPESLIINPNAFSKALSARDSLASNSDHKPTLNKKFRSFSGKPAAVNASVYTAASSFYRPSSNHNSTLNDSNTAPIVRNDIPDIFWQSVEPYCASITDEDIKLLESQLELNDRYLDFPKLGLVGKHYSLQWAEEDLQQQMREGSRFLDLDSSMTTQPYTPVSQKRKTTDSNMKLIRKNSLIQESVNRINKDEAAASSSSGMSYGPLTQRLISALIEQNLMTPFDNEITDYLDKIGPPQTSYMSPRTMARSFQFSSSHQTQNIERKLKRTLIEQGILELEENEKLESHDENSSQSHNGEVHHVAASGEDEIANEIFNLQNELKLVTKQCKTTISQLLSIARQDMQKQEVKKRLSLVDNEIIDLFEKFKTARLNKKPLTKRDKERAQRLVRERQAFRDELNGIK